MARVHAFPFPRDGSPAGLPRAWADCLVAAARAADPEPVLQPLLAEIGVDGLTWIAATPAGPDRERLVEMWCTAAPAWAARYRSEGWLDVDPRATLTLRRMSPVIWDGADLDGGPRLNRFLAEAARFRVRSGIAVSLRDASPTRAIVAFDCAESPLTETRCAGFAGRLGPLLLLATAIHECVLQPRYLPPSAPEGALTARQRECLRMAARGLTSADVGTKLGIAERTVNYHLKNAMRKLDAINRSEAVAIAAARGLLAAGPGAAQRTAYPE